MSIRKSKTRNEGNIWGGEQHDNRQEQHGLLQVDDQTIQYTMTINGPLKKEEESGDGRTLEEVRQDVKEEMPEPLQVEAQATEQDISGDQDAEAQKERFQKKEMVSWNAVSEFRKASGETQKVRASKYREDYDGLNLSQLKDVLEADSKSKSELFMRMYESLDRLLGLAASGGKEMDENGVKSIADFTLTLTTAREAVRSYITTRKGDIFRIRENGKRRIDIAERIDILLGELTEEATRQREGLLEKEKRMARYKQKNLSEDEIKREEALHELDENALDAKMVIETGDFGPKLDEESQKKAENEWLAGNFTAELLKLLGNPEKLRTSEEKNKFLAAITDKNNLLLANKMTLRLLCEADPATLDMPWLRTDLTKAIAEQIDNETFLTSSPKQIAERARQLLDEYRENYADEIQTMKEHRDKLLALLPVDGQTDQKKMLADVYAHPKLQELLNGSFLGDEKEFDERLAEITEKIAADDALLKEELGKRYSAATCGSILRKLNGTMAGLRLFGSSSEVLSRAGVFFDMLNYTAPKELRTERHIDEAMDSVGIPKSLKESFIRCISLGATEELQNLSGKKIKQLAKEAYKQAYAPNQKWYTEYITEELIGKEKTALPAETWAKLDDLLLQACEHLPDEFKEAVKACVKDGQEQTGQKATRQEYLTRRSFDEANKSRVRLKHTEAEQKRLEQLGSSLDSKFLVLLSGEKGISREKFQKTDDVYRNQEAYRAQQDAVKKEANKAMVQWRRRDIKQMLFKAGIPKKEHQKILEQFAPLIEGVMAMGKELFDDERLECARRNLENFGVRTWGEALAKINIYLPSLVKGETHSDIAAAKEQYEAGLQAIGEYDNGKFKEIAGLLAEIPDVYAAMMNPDAEVLSKLMDEVIAPRFGEVLKGRDIYGQSEWHAKPICQRYIYSSLSEIYNGTVSGSAEDYAQRMKGYKDRLYAGRIDDNLKTVEKEAEYIIKSLNHAGEKSGKIKLTSAELALITTIRTELIMQAEDEEHFDLLMDKKALAEAARRLAEQKIGTTRQELTFSSDIEKAVTKKFTDEVVGPDAEFAKARKNIQDAQKNGKRARADFLGLDRRGIESVRRGKSLVRVAEKGQHTVAMDTARADRLRGAFQENIDFLLPDVLRDAIIEKGAYHLDIKAWNFRRKNKDNPMASQMYRHAYRMHQLYDYLCREAEGDAAMSQEEAQMYVLRMYTGPDTFRYFEEDANKPIEQLRKTEDYKIFRENYKALRNLEKDEYRDPSLEREKTSMARDLRILLLTQVGMTDEQGKTVQYQDLKDGEERNKFNRRIGEKIKQHADYLKYAAKVESIIRGEVKALRSTKDYASSVFEQDVEVLALREYFMQPMIEQLKEGKEFNEQKWKDDIHKFYSGSGSKADAEAAQINRRNLIYQQDSVSAKDRGKKMESRRMETGISEKTVADIIANSALMFHGRENRYEKLDEDQKRFFAVALMLMDKGSIGDGTSGTNALLYAKEDKKKLSDSITKELQNYVEGKPYHINVDYTEAIYKLTNYDNSSRVFGERWVLSKTAYEKAMLFAQEVFKKKEAFTLGEKDVERMSDGVSSIEAAFLAAGKTQKNEADKLKGEELAPEDVMARLIAEAEKDQVSKVRTIVGAGMAMVGAGAVLAGHILQHKAEKEADEKAEKEALEKGEEKEDAEVEWKKELMNSGIGVAGEGILLAGSAVVNKPGAHYKKMSSIKRRLAKLAKSKEQVALFLRVMQNRTVLDKSTGDPSAYANEGERTALLEALSGDMNVAAQTLAGFSDSESCQKAMLSAMSFQLRDDMYFKGKVLGKEHFAKDALSRETTMDWELIGSALDFVDEVRNRRAKIYATSHAKDFIRESGNENAIRELDKLEKEYQQKEDFDQQAFEDKMASFVESSKYEVLKNAPLKEHMPYGGLIDKIKEKDITSVEEDQNRLWAGYQSLSNQEKNLFFKVLMRRDLLDISKENYMSNFFGINERDYLNPSGRNALINEYIKNSLSGGIGVQLDKDAYYEAMKSLLSTQVSDRGNNFMDIQNLSGKVKGIFSYERYLFLQRGTAIDWKLFKRALNFVNRATNELKFQEGNALLYQGAGDMAQYGKITVDYSFLRRNFHKVGNQWIRYAGKRFAKRANEELGIGKVLDKIVSDLNGVSTVFDKLGIDQDGIVGQGLKWATSTAEEIQGINKKIQAKDTFGTVKVRTKKEQKEYEKSAEEKKKDKEKKKAKERKEHEELDLFNRMKAGFDNIIATEQSIEKAMSSMQGIMIEELNGYFGFTAEEVSAKQDENNLVNKTVKGKEASTEKGDFRDKFIEGREIFDGIKEFYDSADEMAFMQNLKALMVYGTEKLVYGTIINGGIIKNNKLFVDEKGEALSLTREKEIEKLKENAYQYVSEKLSAMAESVFGEKGAKDILSVEQFVFDNKELIDTGIKRLTKGIAYGKKCWAHVKSINSSIKNLSKLSEGEKDAKEHREADQETLEKSKETRLSDEQYKKVQNIVSAHRGLSGMADTIADAMQKFNIASDVINFAIETVDTFGGKFNFGEKMIATAIQEGLEFAMFAMRVCTDRKVLQDYFFTTDAGKAIVQKINGGFQKNGMNPKQAKGKEQNKKAFNTLGSLQSDYSLANQALHPNALDIISDAQGYEHTSELVEDVGMSMAQSLVFCASNYNPMMETKLMAITVMAVMGLSTKDIGKTTPDVAEKLFRSFKMDR